MGWFSKVESVKVAAEPSKPDCPHDDWEITGNESAKPMCGTCTKCRREIGLWTLLNNWKARIERELIEAKALDKPVK